MRHSTHINESCRTYRVYSVHPVMSHIQSLLSTLCHVTGISESCHKYRAYSLHSVTSRIQSHVTHTESTLYTLSCHSFKVYSLHSVMSLTQSLLSTLCHVTHIESTLYTLFSTESHECLIKLHNSRVS